MNALQEMNETSEFCDEASLRAQALAAVRRLDALGLNRGSTGNLSVRHEDGCLITPTGMGADDMKAQDFVRVGENGRTFEGRWHPSSEWPLHTAIYRARPEVQAVVHTHSVHATALACLERPLPPFHYMVAVAGGDDVPCVPYHLFGSPELSEAVVDGLQARDACLMAHHGLVTAGRSIAHAMKLAVEIESLCHTWLQMLAVQPEPPLLSAAQMAAVRERFKHYGRARRQG
ncbi:L-fuculose-phosphate aldolase [Variovorax defluvii]|uniref:L-fuculose-phosphate aldolase n=1 Tax=Variovorax defluvii TaxID=913761 RepID=A0ABP8IBJ3_9BURK